MPHLPDSVGMLPRRRVRHHAGVVPGGVHVYSIPAPAQGSATIVPEQGLCLKAKRPPGSTVNPSPAWGVRSVATTFPARPNRVVRSAAGFNPDKLHPLAYRRRSSWWHTITSVLLAIYLPNTWVFWIDYPWNAVRMTWVKMFPILPSLYPAAWLAHITGLRKAFDDVGMFVLAGCFTIMLLAGGVLLSRRSWRWLIPVCIVLLAFEIFNAYVSHALFRM